MRPMTQENGSSPAVITVAADQAGAVRICLGDKVLVELCASVAGVAPPPSGAGERQLNPMPQPPPRARRPNRRTQGSVRDDTDVGSCAADPPVTARVVFDVAQPLYDYLARYADEVANQVGVARVPRTDVMRALVLALASSRDVQATVGVILAGGRGVRRPPSAWSV